MGTPPATTACCSASRRSRRRATATTRSPARASAVHVAQPMPADAPVTSATLLRHLSCAGYPDSLPWFGSLEPLTLHYILKQGEVRSSNAAVEHCVQCNPQSHKSPISAHLSKPCASARAACGAAAAAVAGAACTSSAPAPPAGAELGSAPPAAAGAGAAPAGALPALSSSGAVSAAAAAPPSRAALGALGSVLGSAAPPTPAASSSATSVTGPDADPDPLPTCHSESWSHSVSAFCDHRNSPETPC